MQTQLNTRKEIIILVLWSLFLATMIRWPSIPYVYTTPLDPNFGFHALSSAPFNGWNPLHMDALNYPFGIPTRYIAIPTLFIAKVLALFVKPVVATNIAVWIWLALQGIGVGYLFSDTHPTHRLLLSTIAICNPYTILALGNGQWENVAIFPILLVIKSVQQQRWVQLTLALGLCGLCSPYILLSAFICIVPFAYTQIKEIRFWSSITIPTLLCFIYFNGSDSGQTLLVGPASSSLKESASVIGLFSPFNQVQEMEFGSLNISNKIQDLMHVPTMRHLDVDWSWISPTVSSYLGLSIISLATIAWVKNREKRLLFGIILSVLLAMGSSILIGNLEIPLPWKLSEWTPLRNMSATYRLLAATMVFLVLLIRKLSLSPKYACLAIVFVLVDSLLIAPVNWPLRPLQAVITDVSLDTSQPAIAFWPAPPLITPHNIVLVSLTLNKPVALFEDPNASMPTKQTKGIGAKFNREGLTPDEWRSHLKQYGINQLMQYTKMHTPYIHPFIELQHPFSDNKESCGERYCLVEFSLDSFGISK